MIELCIEEYCHDCLDFTPVVDKNGVESFYLDADLVKMSILCKFRKRCAAVEKHISKVLKKKKEENTGDGSVSGNECKSDCKRSDDRYTYSTEGICIPPNVCWGEGGEHY